MLRRALLCVALVLAGLTIPVSPALRCRLHRAGLQQDRGFPARLDPGGHHRDPAAGRAEQLHRRGDRGRRRSSPTPTWPGSRRSSGCPPPATCSTPPSRPRSSGTSAPAAATSGVHAAADTEYDWPWYGNLVGAYFLQPPGDPAGDRADRGHRAPVHRRPAGQLGRAPTSGTTTAPTRAPTCTCWPTSTRRPTPAAAMGVDHPIAWCRAYDGGRSWYTGLGHTQESYSEANFRTHLLGGIRYAAQGAGNCAVGSGRSTRRLVHPGDAGQGRRRDRRADGPDRAAQPRRAAHLAGRRRPLHRRRRQHQGGADPAGLHARRGGSAEHQGRPELRHQPVGVPLLRAAAVAHRPATRRPPAPRRSSPRSTASTGWPGSPCAPTTRSTRPRR